MRGEAPSLRRVAKGNHHLLNRVLQRGESPCRLLDADPDDTGTAGVGKAAQPAHREGARGRVPGYHSQCALNLGQLLRWGIAQELECQVDALRPHPTHTARRGLLLKLALQPAQLPQQRIGQGDGDERADRFHR